METLRPVPPDVARMLESHPRPWPSPSAARMLREAAERARDVPAPTTGSATEPAPPSLADERDAIVEQLLAFAHLLVLEVTQTHDDPSTQLRALRLIAARPSISPAALARALSISTARASVVVLRLVRAGLVRVGGLAEAPRDRELSLSPAGKRMADEVRARLDAFACTLLGPLGPVGRQRVRAASRELLVAIEECRARDYPGQRAIFTTSTGASFSELVTCTR